MTITYDKEADAKYINLELDSDMVARTEELQEGVNIDYSADGRVLGIEVLNVSKNDGPFYIVAEKVFFPKNTYTTFEQRGEFSITQAPVRHSQHVTS